MAGVRLLRAPTFDVRKTVPGSCGGSSVIFNAVLCCVVCLSFQSFCELLNIFLIEFFFCSRLPEVFSVACKPTDQV